MLTDSVTTYDPPYKTMFFVCYSTVAAIVATEAGLSGDSDSHLENQPYDGFAFGHQWYLVEEREHPWCGFGRMDNAEVGYLAPDGSFITEEEYQAMVAERSDI